jgi:hypothetical protein
MSLRDDIVRVAREQIGKPYDERYSFPWEGPASDYDSFNCSGLVRAVYDECGVTIPGFQRASLGDSQSRWVMDAGNWHWGTDGLQPGDLVFWQDGETWEDTYHVGIYTGEGMCVSANGPRMGVCEHDVYIDQGFIGGGWPLALDYPDGWDDPQDEQGTPIDELGDLNMINALIQVNPEGTFWHFNGSKVVALTNWDQAEAVKKANPDVKVFGWGEFSGDGAPWHLRLCQAVNGTNEPDVIASADL